MEENLTIYSVIVDGVEYKSTGPITALQVRQKRSAMLNSHAFSTEKTECEDCNKETEDNLVRW